MKSVVVLAVVLVLAGFGVAVLAERSTPAAAESPTNLPGLAERIRTGQIDVGTQYGMAPDRRYHRIHADVLGLDCATCHAEKFPAGTEIFAVPMAVDVSRNSPAPVDRRVCIGCHTGGIGSKVYGP